MTFTESISSFWSKYADFNGRAGRAEYWWPQLFLMVCWFIITTVFAEEVGDKVFLLFNLITITPILSLSVRRFNDLNLSKWIPIAALGFVFLGYLSAYYGLDAADDTLTDVWWYFPTDPVCFIWGMCAMPSTKKQTKENKK